MANRAQCSSARLGTLPLDAHRRRTKLGPVETINIGELVKVGLGSSARDGIVFDVPSRSKVVVAVVDAERGPRFRTVSPKELTKREEQGPDDRALQLLIRRTPPAVGGAAGSALPGRRGQAGFKRGATHRTTGR